MKRIGITALILSIILVSSYGVCTDNSGNGQKTKSIGCDDDDVEVINATVIAGSCTPTNYLKDANCEKFSKSVTKTTKVYDGPDCTGTVDTDTETIPSFDVRAVPCPPAGD